MKATTLALPSQGPERDWFTKVITALRYGHLQHGRLAKLYWDIRNDALDLITGLQQGTFMPGFSLIIREALEHVMPGARWSRLPKGGSIV